jgi:alpha-mannosidase
MFESPRFALVAHIHWDREWYLPFEAFQDRLVELLDRLLELFEGALRTFNWTTRPRRSTITAFRPEREAEVRRAIADGTLAVGAWFTLADQFLVSGQTIVRSLERGSDQPRELDPFCRIGYLPDELERAGLARRVALRTGGAPSHRGRRGARAGLELPRGPCFRPRRRPLESWPTACSNRRRRRRSCRW